jgi:hypothetical protein
MKQQTLLEGLKEAMGGTPTEIVIKSIIALVTMLWANIVAIAMGAVVFFILLLTDAIMGYLLARRKGEKFSSSKFAWRTAGKFVLTATMMFCLSVVDGLLPKWGWMPESPLLYSGAAFLCVTQLRDVAQKYGTLSNSKLANWLENKLGSMLHKDEKQQG